MDNKTITRQSCKLYADQDISKRLERQLCRLNESQDLSEQLKEELLKTKYLHKYIPKDFLDKVKNLTNSPLDTIKKLIIRNDINNNIFGSSDYWLGVLIERKRFNNDINHRDVEYVYNLSFMEAMRLNADDVRLVIISDSEYGLSRIIVCHSYNKIHGINRDYNGNIKFHSEFYLANKSLNEKQRSSFNSHGLLIKTFERHRVDKKYFKIIKNNIVFDDLVKDRENQLYFDAGKTRVVYKLK